jgi:hypothetical protein
MDIFDKMVKAMIEADSGPEGSILFDVHYNEFHDGHALTLRAALIKLASLSRESRLVSVAQDSFENDGLGVNPTPISNAFEVMIKAILEGKA